MNCAHCQAPLREGASFCTNCGNFNVVSPSSSAPSLPPATTHFDLANAATQMGNPAGSGPPAASSSAPFDPTIRARPPDQPVYPPPAPPSGQVPYPPGSGAVSGPGVSSGNMAYLPTAAASGPAASPYGGASSQPTIAASGQPVTSYSSPGGLPPTISAPGPVSAPYGAAPAGSMPSPYADPYAMPPASGPWTDQPLNPPPLPLTLRLFGADADAVAARASTRLQGTLLRNVSLRYAVSKWFTSVLGAVVALGVGLLLTLITQALWAGSLGDLVKIGDTLPQSQQSDISGVIAAVKSLLNSSLLNVFLMAHHVPLQAHYSGPISGDNYTIDAALSLPLLGLILAPALALTLGGYIAASSDYQRVARYSIARGALMGPFYGLLLLFVALLSSSTVNLSDFLLDSQASGSITISPSAWQALLYGLLWGVLFGALGGWIQLRGRGFLAGALSSLQTLRRSRVAGAISGAGVAFFCGVLLALAVIFAFAVFTGTTVAATTLPGASGAAPSANSLTDPWQVLRLLFAFGPAGAISLFTLAAGGPYAYAITYSGANTPPSISSTVGLVNADHPITNSLFFLLMLIPAISYLAGGRVAARVARAKLAGDALVAGAAMAVPLCLLVALAGLVVGPDFSLTYTTTQSSGVEIGSGPSFWGTLLAVLVGGAVLGGLGGASEIVLPKLGAAPRLLLLPLRPIGWPLFKLFDGLTVRPAGQQRSAAEGWLYDGVLVAVVMSVIVLVLYPLNSTLATSMPFAVLRGIDSWAAALLVGLPLIFFTGALVSAFSAPAPQPAPALSGAYVGVGMAPGGPMWPASQPFQTGSQPTYASQPFQTGSQPTYPSQPFQTGSQPSYPSQPIGTAPQGYPSQPMGTAPQSYPSQPFTSGSQPSYPPTQIAGAPGSQPYAWPGGASGSQPPTQIAGAPGSQPYGWPGGSGVFPPAAQPPTPSQPFPPSGPVNTSGSSQSGQ